MHVRIMAWIISVINFFLCLTPGGLQPRLVKAKFAVLSNPVAGFQTDALLIWRGGEILHEEYLNGCDENTVHDTSAITRTVLAALVGIAIDEGYIKSVDQKVVDFYPDVAIAPGQESKRDMTIGHLLAMTSGIDDTAAVDEFWNAPDLGKVIFALPQEADPGTKPYFRSYRSATVELLSGLLTRALGGRSALEYANEKLFGPLGITNAKWESNVDGTSRCTVGLSLAPRDMLRFGLLYLNEGNFEGKQIVPAAWVRQSRPGVRESKDYWDREAFSNHFYAHEGTSYAARGAGGQFIVIDPDNNTVIVRTGNEDAELGFFQFILPLLRILFRG